MAERIIDTSMLTAEANALRSKGLTGNIEFKSNGFADAITSLPTAEEYEWDIIIPWVVQDGNTLLINQAYSATQTSDILEVI